MTPRPVNGYVVSCYDAYADEGGDRANSYFETLVQGVRGALDTRGFRSRVFRPWLPEGTTIIRSWDQKPPAFVVTYNLNPSLTLGDDLILDRVPSRVVCVLLDHPAHAAEKILSYAKFRDFRYGAMDPAHADYLIALGVPPAHVFLFPQAGPAPRDDVPGFAARERRALFFGGINEVPSDAEFGASRVGGDPLATRALARAVERILADGGEDVAPAVLACLTEAGFATDAPMLDMAVLIREVDLRARAIRRHRLFAALKGTEVHFYGWYTPEFRAANPKGVFHGAISFGAALELARASRVVVNDTINLRHAALIRFFYSIANGALVATEKNAFIDSQFGNGVRFIDRADAASADALADSMDDRRAWEERTAAATAALAAGHTWNHRADALAAQLA